jgi:hypothetical protein
VAGRKLAQQVLASVQAIVVPHISKEPVLGALAAGTATGSAVPGGGPHLSAHQVW